MLYCLAKRSVDLLFDAARRQASSDLGVCFCSQTGDKALMQEGKTAEQNYKKDQGNNAQFGKDEMAAFKGVRCSVLL